MKAGIWICPACETDNQSSSEICAACGCSSDPTEKELADKLQATARKPNTITVWEGLLAVAAVPACIWYAWAYTTRGTAKFSLSRNAKSEFEVIGPYSSFLVTLAMLVLASFFISRLIDYFDVRGNERSYAKFALRAWFVVSGLLVAAVYVGWRFEFIRSVPR